MDIVERAKAITLSPVATWPVIDAETHTPQSLFVTNGSDDFQRALGERARLVGA